MKTRRNLLAITALLLLALVQIQTATAASVPRYDPHNEGIFDRITRHALRTLLSRTDEDITAGRLANEAVVHPTFHPSITVLDDASRVDEILAMPDRPAPRPGLDDTGDELPWQIRASRETKEERERNWKVWVVLATAQQSDQLSRSINEIFNDTVALAADHEGGADPNADVAARKAATYNYAVVDFDEMPDLMWRWWIWKVPMIVFITPSTSPSRAYDVRYYKVAFITGLTPPKLLAYIGHNLWLERLEVWTSSLAPGGKYSYWTLALARPSNWLYENFSRIPSWIVGMLAAGFTSTLIKWLHGGGQKKEKKQEEKEARKEESGSSSAVGGGGGSDSSDGAKMRK